MSVVLGDGIRGVVPTNPASNYPATVRVLYLPTQALLAHTTTVMVNGAAGQILVLLGWRISVAGGAATAGYVNIADTFGAVLTEDIQVPIGGDIDTFAPITQAGPATNVGGGLQILNSAAFTLSVILYYEIMAQIY